jgi:hypothetical protein
VNQPTSPQSKGQQLRALLRDTLPAPDPKAGTGQPRPPLVRSTVYVLRAVAGLVLVLFGMVLLLVFDNALLGVKEDLATIQRAWPDWLATGIQAFIVLFIIIAIIGTNIFLLYRRKFRRWIMINLAALSALLLGALGSRTVLAFATSDALENAIESTASDGLGNDGLAGTEAAPVGRRIGGSSRIARVCGRIDISPDAPLRHRNRCSCRRPGGAHLEDPRPGRDPHGYCCRSRTGSSSSDRC